MENKITYDYHELRYLIYAVEQVIKEKGVSTGDIWDNLMNKLQKDLKETKFSNTMNKVNYIEMVKNVWNVEITQEQWDNIVKQYPDISKMYGLQKSIFGKDHQSTKKLIGYEK